jgi:hypothetical protein
MTLASDNRVTAEYTADGTQVQFTYDFPIFFSDESRGIQVRFVDGTSFEIVDTGEYIVVQNTENTGGYIQFSTAPTSGKIVQIVGKTPVDQQLEIANQSRFDPESIETNFDKIVAILQEWLQQLSDEEKLRIANDLALTNRIDATDKNLASEISNRILADQNLQNQITSNTLSINELNNIISESINNGTSPNLAVFAVSKEDDLNKLKTWDGRTVYVKNIGHYIYDSSSEKWIINYTSPSTILDSSGDTQAYINSLNVPTVSSIASLRNYNARSNSTLVRTTAYYDNATGSAGLINGGSIYYYDATDSTTSDDGIFTIVSSGGTRWKLLLPDHKLNAFQVGLKLQGDDETTAFNNVMSVINAYCAKNSTRIELVGLDNSVKVSGTVTVEVNYVVLNGFKFYVDTSLAPTSITSILKLEGSLEDVKTVPTSIKNIVIQGSGWRTDNNIVGLLCLPSKSLNLISVENVRVLDCKYGLVLGSNTYLINFSKLVLTRCGTCLADSVTAGFESSATNAGENISFHQGVWGESNQFAKINNYNSGAYFSFNNVSFDYSGGNDRQSFVQFDLNKGQYDFNDCHHESGNSFDRVKANYFNLGDYTNVNMRGGWLIFNAVNAIPYFFYCTGSNDDRGKDPHINVRDTWVYAPAVNWWANRGLDYFKPNIAVTDYTTSGKWQELNTMMTNGDMSKNGLQDAYFATFTDAYAKAGETVTDSQTNSLLSVSYNSVARAVEMKRLKQTNSDTLNGGIFYILVPRQPSRYNPHVELSYKTDVNTDISSGNIYITASPVRWSGQVNKYGTPINLGTIDTIGSARISSLTTDGGSVSITNYASQRMDYKNANYVLITINMSSLINKVNFQISDIKLSQAD